MLHVGQRVRLRGRLDGAQTARPGVHGGAAELVDPDADAGELLDHGRPGDEGEGVAGHDHQVGEAEEEGGPGQGRTGDDDDHRHHPRARGQGPGRLAPAVQRGHAVGHVGPARGQDQHHRDAEASAPSRRPPRMVSPSSMERAPRRSAETDRTTMAGRPPSSSTPARTVPVTSRRMIGASGSLEGHRPMLRSRAAGVRTSYRGGASGGSPSGGSRLVDGCPTTPVGTARRSRRRRPGPVRGSGALGLLRRTPPARSGPVVAPVARRRSTRSNSRSTSAQTSGSSCRRGLHR